MEQRTLKIQQNPNTLSIEARVILQIYQYFSKQYSIPNICSTIHHFGGDVQKAVKELAQNHPYDCDLSFKHVTGTNEVLENYFAFKDN